MKKILLFTAFTLISLMSFSQDFISFKRGTRLEVIVTEITPTLIRYKMFSEPKGRVYFVYKDDVAGIMYQDGRVETFNQSTEYKTDNTLKEDENQKTKKSEKSKKEFESIYTSEHKTNNNLKETENQQPSTLENIEIANQSITNWNQASDFILLRDGTRKMVSILEITPIVVKYKDYDNPDGATYTINKSDVTKIVFQNGKEETFIPETNPLEWIDNKIYLDGKKLSNDEIKNLFQGTNSLALYSKSKLYKNLGTGVMLLGIVPFGIGLGGLASFKDNEMGGGRDAMGISKGDYIIFLAGGALIATGGLVMSFQGEKYKKRAVELYNQSPKRRNDLSLNVGLIGNGLGFSVTF